MIVLEQHGTPTEHGFEHTMADGHILQLSKVTISRDREGWRPKFSTLVDEPRGYNRPAIEATRSGCLWVRDAMHNEYELGLDEVAVLLEKLGREERQLLDRMLKEAARPISTPA
jgi:hypothetical protein